MQPVVNREGFYNALRGGKLFPEGFSQEAVDGIEAIFNEWDTGKYGDNLNDLAYNLTTTYHETDERMSPIREYGRGKGRKYGNAYGRGFAMITWPDNYAKMERLTGIPLKDNYDNALKPGNAAKILLVGHKLGAFRGKKLSDYNLDDTNDLLAARDIINPDKHYDDAKNRMAGFTSRGKMIASYYSEFRKALSYKDVVEPKKQHDEETTMYVDAEEEQKSAAGDGDLYDNLPPLPQEYYDWLADKRKHKQAEAYAELNRKPLVKSGVTGFVAAGVASFLTAIVSQYLGVEIPPEAKDWIYGTIITVMGSGAIWKRMTATKLITSIF